MKPSKKLVILAVKAACLLTASNVTILARLGIGGFRKFPEALHLYARLPDTSAVSPQLRKARACRCHIGIAARRAFLACVNPIDHRHGGAHVPRARAANSPSRESGVAVRQLRRHFFGFLERDVRAGHASAFER